MTPGARIAAAIEILAAIETGDRPADDVAAPYFRRRRYIGAKDRAAVSGLVYGVLRHRAGLDWWIERMGSGAVASAGRGRLFAALMLLDGWTPERIASCCDGDRFRPAPLAPSERNFLERLAGHTLHHPHMSRAAANNLPEWLLPHLEAVYGHELESEMAALNGPAPVDLRVNLLKIDRAGAIRALAAEKITATATPWSPVGLRLAARAPLSGLTAFRKGLVEVQDEGSQIAALLADARPGMRVVDFCAGAGGKTLALAAQMKNRGKLVACDVSAWRLERSGLRLRRAGVGNVERRSLASERDKWVKRHAKSFDRVFVDAPCLGTGTWRRNPDAKWRSRPLDLAELAQRQQEILKSAARLVRPGGRLVYATCSLLHEEDEEQAEAFLAAEPDFTVYPVAQSWQETIGGSSPGGERFLRLTPARHATDGFFVASFARKAADPTEPEPEPEPEPEREPDEGDDGEPDFPSESENLDFEGRLDDPEPEPPP